MPPQEPPSQAVSPALFHSMSDALNEDDNNDDNGVAVENGDGDATASGLDRDVNSGMAYLKCKF